ncbi:hypothetical protein EV2_023674 [Malus domestica]
MGFLRLGEDAHLQLKVIFFGFFLRFGSGRRQRRKVKNMEGLQRQRVLRGGQRQDDVDESQVVMLKMDYGGFWRFVTAKKKELEALRS